MAQLPNSDKSFIDPVKVRDYILSPEHPVGRFKAALFQRMGYTKEDSERFMADIKRFHLPLDADPVEENRYGRKYVISGPVEGPNGKKMRLKSVWIILRGDDVPRFITIYPEGGRDEV